MGQAVSTVAAGASFFELGDAGLVHADHVRVGQIVFRREAVGRIDEEPGDECRGREERQPVPVRRAAVQGRHGHEQHQRIHGQQVTREQCAAQHAEEKSLDRKQEKNAPKHERIDRGANVACGVAAGIEQQRGRGHEHRHKEIHVRGEVQDAMPEGGEDAQRRERRLGVMAQELGIAEEEAGFGVVVGVPRGQWENAARKPCGFTQKFCAQRTAVLESHDKINRGQRERNCDRGFLGKCGGGKPQRRGPGLAVARWQRVIEYPQRTRRGKDVGVGQRALRKPNRVEAREQQGPEGHRSHAHQAHRQPPHREQREVYATSSTASRVTSGRSPRPSSRARDRSRAAAGERW